MVQKILELSVLPVGTTQGSRGGAAEQGEQPGTTCIAHVSAQVDEYQGEDHEWKWCHLKDLGGNGRKHVLHDNA